MPEFDPMQTQEEPEQKISVTEWVKRFEASEKVMKREFRPKYAIAKKRLRSEYDVKNRNSAKMTHEQVNLVYSIGTSCINSIYFKSPNCNLTAREEVQHDLIENTEIKVNDWLKDKKVKNVIRKCLWDAYLGGNGWRFIDYEYDDIEDQNNIVNPGAPEQIDELGNVIPAIPPKFGRIILKNEITIQRIRPDLMRFPKGFDFDNYQDSPWLGFDLIIPIEEVRSNDKWDINIRQAIKGEKYEKLSDADKRGNETDGSDALYAKVSYAFMRPENALEKMKMLVFCHEYKEAPLEMIEYDKGQVGYPVKPIYHNPTDDDCSYPCGDPWLWESQLNAIDKWWRTYSRHVEKSNPHTFYDSGAITKEEIQKAKSSNDLEYIGVLNKQQRDLRALIYDREKPSVNKDVSIFYEVARQLLSEISPKSGLSRGAQDDQTESATEAKIINAGEMIDIEARIDDVKEFIIDIVLDVAGILEKSLAAPMPVKKKVQVPNELGGIQEIDQIQNIGSDGFTSKINVDVDVESMQAQNKDVLRAQLIKALELFVKLQPLMGMPGKDENGFPVPPKTINWPFWLQKLSDTMNIKNIDRGFMELIAPILPVPAAGGEQGDVPTGEMLPEAIEAGMGQRV